MRRQRGEGKGGAVRAEKGGREPRYGEGEDTERREAGSRVEVRMVVERKQRAEMSRTTSRVRETLK